MTQHGLRMLLLNGDISVEDKVFKSYAAVPIESMRGNMTMPMPSLPPLWLAFVSGPTGDPARYNTQPTPQGITCTP